MIQTYFLVQIKHTLKMRKYINFIRYCKNIYIEEIQILKAGGGEAVGTKPPQ